MVSKNPALNGRASGSAVRASKFDIRKRLVRSSDKSTPFPVIATKAFGLSEIDLLEPRGLMLMYLSVMVLASKSLFNVVSLTLSIKIIG